MLDWQLLVAVVESWSSWELRWRYRLRAFNLSAHLAGAIQSETRGGTSGRMSQRLRHGFIVAQIAMALVLLEGAGLLGLSLKQAMAVSPGFRPDHVLTGRILLPRNQYPNWHARLAFNERLLAEVSRQPGVTAVGAVNNVRAQRQQREERRYGERLRAPAW